MNKSSKLASICRGVSYTLTALGAFVAILAWILTGNFLRGFGLFLAILLSSMIEALVFYVLGTILENQCLLQAQNHRMDQKLQEQFPDERADKKAPGMEAPSYFTRLHMAPGDRNKNGWVCPKCGTVNRENSRSCVDCGHYR